MSSGRNPSSIDTEFLNELRDNSNIPKDSWYFIAAATLTVLNRPENVVLVLSHAIGSTTDAKEQLRVTRRIREALIKSASIGGLPKASTVFLFPMTKIQSHLCSTVNVFCQRMLDRQSGLCLF